MFGIKWMKKKGEKKQKKKLKGGKILVWYLDSFMLGVVYWVGKPSFGEN